MNRTSVRSSNLHSVGYSSGTLEIEFRDGGIYQYLNVPVEVYTALMNASSHGIYFHRNIRNVYQWEKIRSNHTLSQYELKTMNKKNNKCFRCGYVVPENNYYEFASWSDGTVLHSSNHHYCCDRCLDEYYYYDTYSVCYRPYDEVDL